MIDRYDEKTGFTSMARTTAFTGAIVAGMVAAGNVQGTGLVHPEELITGPLFEQLLDALAACDINFTLS